MMLVPLPRLIPVHQRFPPVPSLDIGATVEPELIEAYRGTVSLPFEPGKHQRVAVKIVDDRGIESLEIVEVT